MTLGFSSLRLAPTYTMAVTPLKYPVSQLTRGILYHRNYLSPLVKVFHLNGLNVVFFSYSLRHNNKMVFRSFFPANPVRSGDLILGYQVWDAAVSVGPLPYLAVVAQPLVILGFKGFNRKAPLRAY